MLFALGFVSMFVIGGLSGIYLAAVPIDIHVSDTYFVVAHIHYVLFGGSLFTIFAGIYFWFPKMTGRMYNERLGKLHFWLTFVGFNLTFFPMHWLGIQGMPRRVADYVPRFADLNLFISLASFGLGASTLVFLYNMIYSWRFGPAAEANPWRSLTLEWQVSSPPPIFNFDEIPQVVGGPYEYGVEGARHAVFNGDRVGEPRRCRRSEPAGEARARDRERDGGRADADRGAEAAGRGRPAARDGRRAGEPARARATSSTRTLAVPRPEGGSTGRSRRCARRGSPRPATSSRPIRSRRSGTRSRSSSRVPTRSSSRRTRASAPAGCGGTSSSGSSGRPTASRSSTSSWTSTRRGRRGERARGRERDVVGDALLDKIRERVAKGPRRFLILCPQSDTTSAEHPEAERRLRRALTILRGEGIDAHGQVAHPDPFTAASQAVQRRAGRRDHRLDLPRRDRSNWLRGDLVNRLRKATGRPVDHIEVDPEPEAAPV